MGISGKSKAFDIFLTKHMCVMIIKFSKINITVFLKFNMKKLKKKIH